MFVYAREAPKLFNEEIGKEKKRERGEGNGEKSFSLFLLVLYSLILIDMVMFLLSLARPGRIFCSSHPSYQPLAFEIKVPYD